MTLNSAPSTVQGAGERAWHMEGRPGSLFVHTNEHMSAHTPPCGVQPHLAALFPVILAWPQVRWAEEPGRKLPPPHPMQRSE